jgi:hypothetical protein
MFRKLGLLLGLALAAIAGGAQAIPIADNQLYVVISKNGTEAHFNLGDPQALHTLNLASTISGIAAWGGDLTGAVVSVLAVEERGRLSGDFGFGPQPLENIIFSSASAPTLDDQQIAGGMNNSVAWFNTIAAVATNVVLTSNQSSYGGFLGADIGSAFPFSINATVDGTGSLTLEIYSAVRGYADFGGPAQVLEAIGTLSIDGANLSYVPEPGTLILLGAGLAGLAAFERRARRA